ncbi:hypothetical protein QCD71_12400 [Sphingomonas sp. PsM26]|nr:hypothetical protein [Sphingomonas sp. PsM26]
MKVLTDNGERFDLGTTETTPTVGITDYSRRVTDDYGVTTVVERGFSRRMSVRLGVPTDLVDGVQRRLATLRATAATWVADAELACLSIKGFFKDFDIDLSTPSLSYCTLTVEGLLETEPLIDVGGDPSPGGQPSTLQLLHPAVISDATLVSSNVAETEYPAWSARATYASGARVILPQAHRVFESAIAGNLGNDPAAQSGKWIDIGPTNRWAMFDQALGSATDRVGSVAVTVEAPSIQAVALLDVVGLTVRVQATGYDQIQTVVAGAITFLDLPAGITRVSVIIGGTDTVSVGTLLVGKIVGLGITEASPTAGITDYSRKDVDDFGAVTIVERAWAKRMSARALIDTSAIDAVFSRIAGVRATPALWIGQDGFDSLTIYGFFKDFSIEVSEKTSKLSLSIEGLSTAGKTRPFAGGNVDWPNVGDPDGTKPKDNADVTGENTSKDTKAVGGKPVEALLAQHDKALKDIDDLINSVEAIAGGQIEGADEAIAAAEAARDAAKASAAEAYQNALAAAKKVEDASGFATTASGAAQTATQKVTEAGQQAVNAKAQADIAVTKAGTATSASDSAAISERNANDSKVAAARSETLSASSEQSAAGSADASGRSAASASASEGNAGRSSQAAAQAVLDARAQNEAAVAQARIATDQAALATREASRAETNATLSARFGATGGNWLLNTAFTSTDAWNYQGNYPNGNPEAAFQTNAGPPEFHPVGENVLSMVQNAPKGGGTYIEWVSRRFPVAKGVTPFVQFFAFLNAHRANVTFVLVIEDANSRQLYVSDASPVAAKGGIGNTPDGYIRIGTQCVPVPEGATQAYVIFRKYDTNPGNADSYAWLWRPYVGEAREGQTFWNSFTPGSGIAQEVGLAQVDQLGRAFANADSALSQRIDSTDGEIGGLKASTKITQDSVVDLKSNEAAARIRLIATSPGGRATVDIFSSASGGAGVQIGGNVSIHGDLTIDGTFTPRKFNGSSMSREGTSVWQGSFSPPAGTAQAVPFNLTLSQIPPVGRFIYEFTIQVNTNAGQRTTTTMNGRPAYLDYVQDGGGLTVVAIDNQGNQYRPVANGSTAVRAATDFVPSFNASVRNGNYDTGWINNGDYYSRQIAATYTVTLINLKVTWVAI